MKKILSLKGILISLILIVVLLFGALFALFQNIKNENENSSKLQNGVDLSAKQNQYTLSLQQVLRDSGADITKIDSSILSSDGDVGFIEQLENVAKNNGVSIIIDSLAIEDIPNITSYNLTSLQIRASAQSDWAGMIIFLTKLESLPFVMHVEKLDMANSSDNPLNLETPATSAQSWQSVFEIRVLQYK